MTRDRTIQFGALGVMVLALLGSVFLTTRIAASSSEYQLEFSDAPQSATTPEEAMGIAAGAFRGLFVNWLWERAQALKQEGKYHESVDLARTITRLQPRFPRVWAFHAWNLAYNISVAAQDPGERWQWVNAGIRLLRDEGIPKNPQDMLLHKELAWIFLHKVQGITDDANQYYKRQLAREWTIALGPPPVRTPELRDTAKYTEECAKWLASIAAAAPTLEELVADESRRYAEELRLTDPPAPMLPELLARIKDEAKLDLTQLDDVWKFRHTFEVMRSLFTRERARADALKATGATESEEQRLTRGALLTRAIGPEARNDGLIAILSEPRYSPALTLLNRTLRKRLLIDRYHMEPDRMVRYVRRFGPLDWRLPQTHAIYWSARGVEEALDKRDEHTVENMDFLNTDRITIQGLQEEFRGGSLLYDIVTPTLYIVLPSADYIDAYGQLVGEVTERERQQFIAQKGTDTADRVWTLYRAGYENFLHDVISFLYRQGDRARAERYRQVLLAWSGLVGNDINMQNIREWPLEQFVVWNIQERITSPNIAGAEITAALYSAYVQGLLAGDMDAFTSNLEYAKRFHLEYFKAQYRQTAVTGGQEARMEVFPADFRVMASEVMASILLQAPPQDAALIYLRAPKDLQTSTWDILDQVAGSGEGGNQTQSAAGLTSFFLPRPLDIEDYRAQQRLKRGDDVKRGTVDHK